ncbi:MULTISPECIES: sensor domain-containing diguanylate cyclase [unclassified Novosphingobium]|uniref:GGDEF domain-containing protein n=1 Tax=unclassified Novosphingobium TaxID=2644732 RepID=UPI00135B6A51|nr:MULTISPECIES: sensor domain-containing diguanylate cyclase [unclassified Novosphingobium]
MAHTMVRKDEEQRLTALRRLEILDTEPEDAFENIVSLVRTVLGVPIAAVSLIDEDRQWFKARAGLDVSQTPRDISFCSHAIEGSEPFVVTDALLDRRFVDNLLVTGDPGIRSYAGIPLRTADGYNVGALCAIDRKPREFTAEELAMLAKFAKIVENEFALRQRAERDPLTGALTRGAFTERAQQEVMRYRRYGRPCSLVLADLDHFKLVNDTYGHPAGDTVLRETANRVSLAKRPIDTLGRLGGEEFALLLPETDAPFALAAVERFRLSLAGHQIELPYGKRFNVTASFGISELSAGIDTVDRWMELADRALYAAKRAGRNCSRVAEG